MNENGLTKMMKIILINIWVKKRLIFAESIFNFGQNFATNLRRYLSGNYPDRTDISYVCRSTYRPILVVFKILLLILLHHTFSV